MLEVLAAEVSTRLDGASIVLIFNNVDAAFHPQLGRSRLSQRQCQVLAWLVNSGDSAKQIAARLGISERTIQKHIWDIYRRLGMHSRAELLTRYRAHKIGHLKFSSGD